MKTKLVRVPSSIPLTVIQEAVSSWMSPHNHHGMIELVPDLDKVQPSVSLVVLDRLEKEFKELRADIPSAKMPKLEYAKNDSREEKLRVLQKNIETLKSVKV